MLTFHRKHQYDIIPGGIKNPIIVIAWETPGQHYMRLFCLWTGGVWVRLKGKKRFNFWWAKWIRFLLRGFKNESTS